MSTSTAQARTDDVRDDEPDLFRADALIRWQRKLGIAPKQGLGVVRRAIFFALLGWLPIVIWAAWHQRLLEAPSGEPLLAHFGIHVRCLVATPLLILAEAVVFALMNRQVAEFRHSGVIGAAQLPAFRAVLQGVSKLRDRQLPWMVLLGLALAWTLGNPLHAQADEMSWAADSLNGDGYGFGGQWFLYVARPIFVILLFGWFWRIALAMLLFWRLSRLDLALVPTHPDRCGGLGFLKNLPSAYFLVTLALSAVLASRWMHEMLYHGHSLLSFKAPFILFLLMWGGVMILPLLMFVPQLGGLKRQGLKDYGALVGSHGRLVHRRWIQGQDLPPTEGPQADDLRRPPFGWQAEWPLPATKPLPGLCAQAQPPEGVRQGRGGPSLSYDLLEAPELGPVADTAAIFQAVEQIRPAPLAASSVAMVILPALLPMLIVVAAQMPLREILGKLLKAVI